MRGSGYGGSGRLIVAVAIGLTCLTACGGSLTEPTTRRAEPASASPAPLPPPVAATTPLDPRSGLRQQSCRELASEVQGHTIDVVAALAAEPARGPVFRAGVAEAFDRFARNLAVVGTTTAGADPEMVRALGTWSDANAEIAAYVARTEPGPDSVVEFGPGNTTEQSARTAVEKLCGKPF